MSNGLTISEDEFIGLKQKEQNLILFRNQVKTMEMIREYKIYYRITTIIGSILVMGMGILFSFHIGG